MFKFSFPMKVIISSGGFLVILALGSLLVISNAVHTSDIENRYQSDETAAPFGSQAAKEVKSIAPQEHGDDLAKQAKGGGDLRQRSGRLYQPTNQQPIDSYAAAYAAVSPVEQTTSHHISQQQSAAVQQSSTSSANDASAYASFGETPPPPPPSQSIASQIAGASIARQMQANSNDYSPHSNYYASYMAPSSNEASYSGGQFGSASGSYYSPVSQHQNHHHNHYKSQSSAAASSLPLGYPTNAYERSPFSSNYYDRVAHHQAAASSPFFSTSSFHSGAGLMSSASHALSHWTNGFSIGELICGLVAIAIGAIILGAPFFLIYLALMGNFSGSGTLSLTNPTSTSAATGGASVPANGRRKRLAVFDAMIQDERVSKHPDLAAIVDSMVKHLSPLVDLQQASQTFKHLVSSMDKYAPVGMTVDLKRTDSAKQKSS